MNVRRHLSIIWSVRLLAPVLLAAAIVISYFASSLLPRAYEARATLYVGQSLSDPDLGYNGILASQFLARTYAQLANTRPLLSRVIADLALPLTPEALAPKVTTEVPDQGTLLYVIARDSTADGAAAIANGVARHLQALAPASNASAAASDQQRVAQLDAAIAVAEKQLLDLLAIDNRSPQQDQELAAAQDRLSTLSAARSSLVNTLPGLSPNTLSLVEAAIAPTSPIAPSRTVIVAAAAALALLLSITFAYVRDAWRSSEASNSGATVRGFLPPALRGRTSPPDPVARPKP